jgi:hypothetical protein
MESVWAGLVLGLMILSLFLHILSLPANWLVLALAGAWKLTHPEAMGAGWGFFALLAGLCILGEILEQLVQIYGGRRYGSSGHGLFGAFFGGLVGAIMLAPIGFGLGAIPGALGGAYLGGLTFERFKYRSWSEAHRSALGNLYGRVAGMVLKGALGVIMVVLTAPRIWPG